MHFNYLDLNAENKATQCSPEKGQRRVTFNMFDLAFCKFDSFYYLKSTNFILFALASLLIVCLFIAHYSHASTNYSNYLHEL